MPKKAEKKETTEEKVEEKDEADEKLDNEIKGLKAASKNLDVAITQKDQSETELAQAANIDEKVIEENSEPFTKGDYVSHGVYGNGDVLSTTKAGKHWSIEVNFDEGLEKTINYSQERIYSFIRLYIYLEI